MTTPTPQDGIPLVKPEDERPVSKGSGACTYCQEKIGQPHKWECVIPQKWVTVRMTITMPMQFPRSWDKDNIEFKLNESSWCASNIVDELEELSKQVDLCNITEFEFLHEGEVITAAYERPDANNRGGENAPESVDTPLKDNNG